MVRVLESKSPQKVTHVTIGLEEKHNNMLNDSCALSRRRKRQEAELRLSDHLERFPSIASMGNASSRDK